MDQFEKYLPNLDINDENCINDVKICKSDVYTGDYKLIRKQEKVCKCHPSPLASAVLGLENTDIPIPDHLEFYNAWTDMDAQEAYLKTAPTSYLILGKPGTGSYTLGEALSKKINCVHICPKNVLNDEIDQKSSTGQCLDYNMRHNKVCKIDTILSIMKIKLQSPAIKHRGFVISGLPLISSNRKLQSFFDTLNGEESFQVVSEILYDVIFNMKKKKFKAKGSTHSSVTSGLRGGEENEAEEEQEPEVEQEELEEPHVELPKYILDTCTGVITCKKAHYKIIRETVIQQIQEIFCCKPKLIIHITCPNSEVITKRSRKFFNYMSSHNSFDPFILSTDSDIKWPPKYIMRDYTQPFSSHIFSPKYSCKVPRNFPFNAKEHICNFKDHVHSFIEDKLKTHDPKYIVKLDGRTSVHQMMHIIMERVTILPIKPVLVPEPLYLEEPPEDMDDFWKTVEELNVVRSQNVNFNRYPSPWFNRCPVELKKRQSLQGKPRLAVSFFKHVYLLSSLNHMISFCRNPRPFLKLKYLEPTCRIIVIGTKCSGKTLISKCLSWLFEATIICYADFLNNEKQKKYNMYAKNILSEIIPTIEDNRFIKWESIETERISDLNMWFNTNHNILNRYIHVYQEVLKRKEEEQEDDDDAAGTKDTLVVKLNNLRSKLAFLPFLNDIQLCQDVLQGQNLQQHAPHYLLKKNEEPKIPVLGDEDVTTAISAYIETNDLHKEIEPTSEEIMKELIIMLKTLDNENLCQNFEPCYGKFIIDGFPPELEYWEYLSEAGMLPDYTVVLIENREIDDDLTQHYINIEKSIKNYQERYLTSNDVLVKTKLQGGVPLNSTYLDMKTIVEELIQNILNIIFAEGTEKDGDNLGFRTSLSEKIEKFRENWDPVKAKLEDQSKFYGEVELEGKSDITVIDEVLLNLRKAYCNVCFIDEDRDIQDHDENETVQNLLTYNDDRNLSDTNIYCPIALHDYNVLWEGKPEISAKYNNKIIMFSKEECLELFQRDCTHYQSFIKPFKKTPSVRLCVIGTIGCGKTSLSKRLAKEMGLLYVNFDEFINNYLLPKHFKKIGWQYENSFIDKVTEEENIVEFQMDEENVNLISDLLFNEAEIRRIISNYFDQGIAMPSLLIQKIIKLLWFEEPYKSTGIIIDGFPKLPNDLEDMISSYCIPSMVIQLEGNSEKATERISPVMFKIWKNQYKEAKNRAQANLQVERQNWYNFITKNIVVKLIVDEIIDSYGNSDEPLQTLSLQSTVFDANPLGSSNVDPNLFKTYNEVIQEFPEPVDQTEWENPDDVLERINTRIEGVYEVFEENIETLKDILMEQKIKVATINSLKSIEKVFRNALDDLSTLRNRNESFLEQTFIINSDIAEMLIFEGFFFLSKFNRMCPVYLYENQLTLYNPYIISKRKGTVFPVIHRAYIYFISCEAFAKKFRLNPLKYIKSRNIESYVEFPLRISIIGPPKSGKSTLAAKLAKRFGLLCVSRGTSVRHVLDNMRWTQLGSKMMSSLRAGNAIESESIIKSIQVAVIDHRTVTYGIVFDGFPETPFEVTELQKHGLYPSIIFDLKTSLSMTLERSQKEIYLDILKKKPPYSEGLVQYRFHKWESNCASVRKLILGDTQNIHELCGDATSWQCFHSACEIIHSVSRKVHYYLSNYESKVVNADVMCISNEIFKTRMSDFKHFCPMCFIKNIFRNSDHPCDRAGVVQYGNHFYWVCRDHMKDLQKLPKIVLSLKKVHLPEIPAVVKSVDTSLVYESGICIVTYAENLPAQKIVKGCNKFAAIYKEKYYLFCSSKCLDRFVFKPHMYFDINVFKDACRFPPISLNTLPNLGYLEQTIGNMITEACCAVNVIRPKYFGLNIALSAVIYIALYLKTHNARTNPSQLKMYLKAFKIYETRCKLVIDVGLKLRSIDNPFAIYPKCCLKSKNAVIGSDSGTVEKPPSTISTTSWK